MTRRRRAPPSPRTRAETKQATRAALISAAIQEFAEHGLDVSLDAICARAELTRGAFYVHFEDREALIVATMHEVLGGFVRSLAGTAGTEQPLAAIVRQFFAGAADERSITRGGKGLRFHHLLDACHRSKSLGDTYRMIVSGARDQIERTITKDQGANRMRTDVSGPALSELLMLVALGIVSANELAVPLDHSRLAATTIALLNP